MNKQEARDYIGGLALALLMVAGLIWSNIEASDLRYRSNQHMDNQASAHAAMEQAKGHLEVTRAIAGQEAEKAAGHYRKLRELAETMQPNPFQRGK